MQQFMTQASLLELRGGSEAADRFRRGTLGELRHAERIVQRLLALGVAPAASQLRPLTPAADLIEVLHRNAVLEDDLIAHDAEAMRFSTQIGDGEQHAFFRELWQEEQQHRRELATWLATLRSPGRALQGRAWF